MSDFDLDKFRKEFLTSDGWKVSDVYKTYSDEFLRKDAQDAYEGVKWAWNYQQKNINKALKLIKDWEDQTYRDDLEQLLGEIEDILKGHDDE